MPENADVLQVEVAGKAPARVHLLQPVENETGVGDADAHRPVRRRVREALALETAARELHDGGVIRMVERDHDEAVAREILEQRRVDAPRNSEAGAEEDDRMPTARGARAGLRVHADAVEDGRRDAEE